MARKALTIKLEAHIEELLNKLLSKRQVSKQLQERAAIVVLSSQGLTNKEIAAELGFEPRKAALWRNRWLERTAGFDLTQDGLGKKPSDRQLMSVLEQIFADSPRSGRPDRLSAAEKLRLQALACQSPEEFGLPFSVWTHEELSAQAKRIGIEVSPSHYGKLLKKRFTAP